MFFRNFEEGAPRKAMSRALNEVQQERIVPEALMTPQRPGIQQSSISKHQGWRVRMDGTGMGPGGQGLGGVLPSEASPLRAGAPPLESGRAAGAAPPNPNQKQFSLGATSVSAKHQKLQDFAKEWVHEMLLKWVRESNQESQRWVQKIAEDDNSQ